MGSPAPFLKGGYMQESYRPMGESRRLRDLFREAERRSGEVIRLLTEGPFCKLNLSGSKDYVVGLARLVRLLSERGLKAPALEANILAEKTEFLLDLLHVEMTDLL
jgi:Fe-S oxidoreductase